MANNVLPDPLNTDPITKSYFIEVAKGNVPGSETRSIVMRSKNITNVELIDIWGFSTNFVFPTANETWEIVSDNANDDSVGTGAQQVLVNYLDEDYVEQSTVVVLNGTTAVEIATNCFRPDGLIVISCGSGQQNEGNLTVQVSGGGAPRGYIEAGFSASEDTHYTVPAGKTTYLLKASPYWPKNEDGNVNGNVFLPDLNTVIKAGLFPAYQNTYDINFIAPFPLQEKSTLWYRAQSSTNPGPIDISFVLEFIIVDN